MYPIARAFPTLLRAVAVYRARVILGDPNDPTRIALTEYARHVLRPDDAVIVVPPGEKAPAAVATAWLTGRTTANDRATAYVCHGTSCPLTVHESSELAAEFRFGNGHESMNG